MRSEHDGCNMTVELFPLIAGSAAQFSYLPVVWRKKTNKQTKKKNEKRSRVVP